MLQKAHNKVVEKGRLNCLEFNVISPSIEFLIGSQESTEQDGLDSNSRLLRPYPELLLLFCTATHLYPHLYITSTSYLYLPNKRRPNLSWRPPDSSSVPRSLWIQDFWRFQGKELILQTNFGICKPAWKKSRWDSQQCLRLELESSCAGQEPSHHIHSWVWLYSVTELECGCLNRKKIIFLLFTFILSVKNWTIVFSSDQICNTDIILPSE